MEIEITSELDQEIDRLSDWLGSHAVTPVDCDCINAVMLKILDGKCKMAEQEKITMEALYRSTRHLPARHLSQTYHEFIEPFLDCDRTLISESDILAIYEKRVLAETQISRPVMKQFKKGLRTSGVLPPKE